MIIEAVSVGREDSLTAPIVAEAKRFSSSHS
jgi:hypothetical protein